MPILLEAAGAITKGFPKAASTRIYGLPKDDGNFMKKSAEMVTPPAFEIH